MKRSDIPQVVGASLMAAGLTLAPLTIPASAQSNSSPQANTTSSTDNAPRDSNRDNDHRDWGWLGLIGLAGLAGLAKGQRSEPRSNPTAYHDPNVR